MYVGYFSCVALKKKKNVMKMLMGWVIFFSLVHVVKPQLNQAQPCLICGNSLLRIWSLMSRVGDRYLRITNHNDNNNRDHKVVDCGGVLKIDNFTSLLRVRERSTFQETRIQMVLATNNREYHLYASSSGGKILAMPANEGEQEADNRNTWAPERLLYEHRLFTVFQSVKYRGYYLSCDGSGKAVLQQIINKAYRQPNQLFLTIDPGNAIRGVSFGGGNSAARRKREVIKSKAPEVGKRVFWQTTKSYKSTNYRPQPPPPPQPNFPSHRKPFPTRAPPPKYSSVATNFKLPQNITFVLCFWVKTESDFAQLISVTEKVPEKTYYYPWKRRFPHWKPVSTLYTPKKKDKQKNIINVSIYRSFLKLEIGYKRIEKKVPHCPVSDGKFHQICISLDEKYRIEAYQDSVEHLNDTLPELASDFENRNNLRTRRGTLRLGRAPGMKTATLDGSLFQVNLWDQYPSFRIKRIATNCACGGGTLVGWGDLLKGRMSNAKFDSDSVCPKLEGYNYDEITQNRLI